MGFFWRTGKPEAVPATEVEDVQLSAFVLLSEHLRFRGRELVAALREDFPEMEWGGDGFEEVMGDLPASTRQAVVCQLGIGPDLKPALVNNMPGHPFLPDLELMRASHLSPEDSARIATESKAYLNVAVWAPPGDLALRVEAGRRLAAVVSVLAGMPIARAVVWHPSGRVTLPEAFRAGTDAIQDGEMPFASVLLPRVGKDPDQPDTVTSRTQGYAAFLDAEFEMVQSPLTAEETMLLAMGAGAMAAQMGHRFQDGDTMSMPDGPPEDEPIRLRYASAEMHSTGRAHWVLVHRDSPFDHETAYGPLPRRARKRTQESEPGWLQRQLRRSTAH